MVDAAADLEIGEMSLLLASAVDGVRPNGVKTRKKKARTDGDLPLGADAEVPESVVPCGSGSEVGIAIVAPPPSPAHDKGVVTLGRMGTGSASSISAEFLPFEAGASIALNTVEAMSPTTQRKTENLVVESQQPAGRLGSMAFGAV